MEKPIATIRLETLTRRTVRAWWVDGLWDFAIAGFNVIAAVWFHVFVRVMEFPSWTWPWPFITTETVNPMQVQVILWVVGLMPLLGGYTYGAYRLVGLLKSRWLASRQGDVRHPFWLKVEPRMLWIYLLVYLGLFVILTWLVLAVTGGAHFLSTVIIAAYGAVMLALGSTYSIARYIWTGAVGMIVSMLIELFATTEAVYLEGPKQFLDVSPMYGNPAVPLLVFAAMFLVSGLIGLAQVLSKVPDEQ